MTISGNLDDEVPRGALNRILAQSVGRLERMTEYLIIIEKAETNYAAYCPDLPCVIATCPTKKETLELMKEAIEFHLDGLKAERISIPEPTTTAASVDVTV